jgi:hypothetical protein
MDSRSTLQTMHISVRNHIHKYPDLAVAAGAGLGFLDAGVSVPHGHDDSSERWGPSLCCRPVEQVNQWRI